MIDIGANSQNFVILMDFIFLSLVIIIAGIIIYKTPQSHDKEIVKLRFACVTFTGIMAVFIFTAVLYFGSSPNAGVQIFDRAVTSMTPLAGVILGYLFGMRGRSEAREDDVSQGRDN